MSPLVVTIIQTVVAFTLLLAFVFTVVVTCLSLIGVVKFANPKQQQRLFVVLIVEVAVVCVGFFTNLLNFSPDKIKVVAIEEAVKSRGIIYLHIPDATYRSKAEAVQEVLKLNGFVVPGIVMVGANRSPNHSQIRYFFPQQEDQAKLINKIASDKKLGDFVLQYITGYENKVSPNTLEIWYSVSPGP